MPKFGEQPIVPENPDDREKRMEQKIAGERGKGFVEISESTTPETPAEQPESPEGKLNIGSVIEEINEMVNANDQPPGSSYAQSTIENILEANGLDEKTAHKIVTIEGNASGGGILIDGTKVLDYTINDPADPDWSFGIMECTAEDNLRLRRVLESVLEKYGKGTK